MRKRIPRGWIIGACAFILLLNPCSHAAVPADGTVRIVTDGAGRRVGVPGNPERVVALAPSITEIVYALGRGDRLAGAERFSDFPPEADLLPKVGSYIQPDIERIVSLRPDLCIATKDGNPEAAVTRLESLGIPVYVIDPRSLEAVIASVREIGELLDAAHEARVLTGSLEKRIEKVRAIAEKSPRRPRVFFQIGFSPIVSAGTDTHIHELIEAAGGKNAAAGPAPYPRFNREQVIALAPDIIILTTMGREGGIEREKAEWERLPGIPAVRNRRILTVDSNLFDRPTPRLVDALEALLGLLHPELTEGGR